jgi:hypothetical protein
MSIEMHGCESITNRFEEEESSWINCSLHEGWIWWPSSILWKKKLFFQLNKYIFLIDLNEFFFLIEGYKGKKILRNHVKRTCFEFRH